jgi:hypothetical protein
MADPNLDLELQNNCALAALIAAREKQDAALKTMWTGSDTDTAPPSDTSCKVEQVKTLHDSLRALEETRAKEASAWAAHWTTSVIKPAWENNTELEKELAEPETKTGVSEVLPTIEITELS